MIKMYNAEVLSKFPVVQHFPFGSLFSWEQDPNAAPAAQTVHTANHPISQSTASNAPTARPLPQEGTKAPWATQPQSGGVPPTTAPWAKPSSKVPQTAMPPTRAPWVNNNTSSDPIRPAPPDGPTRAPWADQGSGRR
jgi:serine/threonine-protein phosphatase 2A activator